MYRYINFSVYIYIYSSKYILLIDRIINYCVDTIV